MKKIMMIAASLAIVAGLASCQKENIVENGEDTKAGIITATFAESTKVAYDENENNLLPTWEEKDIIVGIDSEGSAFELEVISVNSGVATLNIDEKYHPSGNVALYYKAGLRAENWDGTNKQFIVNLDGQKGDKTMPAIMMATGTITEGNGKFEFHNEGAVLGIYEVGTALQNESIKQVTLYGKNIASSDTLRFDGVTPYYPNDGFNVISTEKLSGITVDTDGKLNNPILMAVPAGARIESVFIRTDKGKVYSLGASNDNKTLAANTYRYIKGVDFARDAKRDDMILTGVYTVSDDNGITKNQVFFSKGNLWYGKVGEAETPTFNIEANQYASTPAASGTMSEAHISHFFWSKSADVAIAQSYEDPEKDRNDVFFTNADDFIVNGQSGWRTLSQNEWKYLWSERPMKDGKARYTRDIKYGNTKGMVIYPDNYDKETYSSNANVTELQEGVVFLPAAGSRSGDRVSNVGTMGSYWTKSHDGADFWAVSFMPMNAAESQVGPKLMNGVNGSAASSVRLVSYCQ